MRLGFPVALLSAAALLGCERDRRADAPLRYPPPTYGQPAPYPAPHQPPTQPGVPLLDLLTQALGSGPPAGMPQLPGMPWPWPTTPQPGQPPAGPAPPVPQGISARALDLAHTINDYRVQNGLHAVPISRALTHVAETHVRDMHAAPAPPGCNGHSWSNRGPWSSCCYTPDHAQARCMWDKPKELTHFKVNGFEIAISRGTSLDSRRALELWRSSPAHHDVILNRGKWQNVRWNAIGAGIIDSQAAVWFAKKVDPGR